MEPNFDNNQYLIVNEIDYRFSHPRRGDVIVFRYPRDHREFFIKRIIGLPNETIKCQSVKYYPESDSTWWSVIHAGLGDDYVLGGAIWDNCTTQGVPPQTGNLTMTITNSGSTPLIAHWEIKREMRIIGHDFSIPTDIMLTKVN